MSQKYPLNFRHAFGEPDFRVRYRVEINDFCVDENLGFIPSGEGEHVFLQVRKCGQNTQWLAREIANFVGVNSRDVGYCGLKDRHANTTQWFSIYWPRNDAISWDRFVIEGVTILLATKHKSKLKPGMHESNHFVIRLRDFSLDSNIENRLKKVVRGVPNYFGEQRFGIGGNNLVDAESLLIERRPIKNKKTRGLIISAARSYLFNKVLSQRVDDNNWLNCLSGEPENDPTGPLWGRGRSLSSDAAAQYETDVLANLSGFANGLEHVGLKQERRALICVPQDFRYIIEKSTDANLTHVVVEFSLSPGQYATSVLREIALLDNAQSIISRPE